MAGQIADTGYLYKYLDLCSNGFWTPKNILTYGRPLMAISGSRSVGKSTGLSVFLLLEWMLKGREFTYTRRNNDELNKTKKTFFDDAPYIIAENTKLKPPIITQKGDFYYATEQMAGGDKTENICGHCIALNDENKVKSSKFPDVFSIVYDEFILKDPSKYLGTMKNGNKLEWSNLYSLFVTTDRKRGTMYRNDTRLFLLGNLATLYNPIFNYMNMTRYHNYKAHFIAPKGKAWVFEQVTHVGKMDSEDVKNSNAYLLADEEERAYTFDNKGADFFEKEFVKRMPTDVTFFGAFGIGGKRYGVYTTKRFDFYISGKIPTGARVLSLDGETFSRNDFELMTKWQDSPFLSTISTMFKKKRVFFDNTSIKNSVYSFLVLLP